mgnify:CR=1 FL=1
MNTHVIVAPSEIKLVVNKFNSNIMRGPAFTQRLPHDQLINVFLLSRVTTK